MSPTLLVAGYLTLDISCRVDSIPPWDARVTATSITRAQGGMAANCACTAARLGTRTLFFGHTETGPLGDEALEALEACGVQTNAVLRTPEGSSFCLIFVASDGRRSIVSEPLQFEWQPLDRALAGWDGGPGALHVDGYRLPAAHERAVAARRAGLLASIDLDGCEGLSEKTLAETARSFDVVFLNRGIAAAVSAHPAELAASLIAEGAHTVCVTLGADGAIVASSEMGPTRVEPLAVEPIDTTGAGDAFAGAFLHRLLQRATPLEAASSANAVAAMSTTRTGARGELPLGAASPPRAQP